MKTQTPCSTRRFACILGLGLALAGAVGECGELPGLRLSGVFVVPGESEWAVIEYRSGEQQIVKVGDQLANIGTVAKISATGIRVDTPKGPRLVDLEWQATAASAPVAASPLAAKAEAAIASGSVAARGGERAADTRMFAPSPQGTGPADPARQAHAGDATPAASAVSAATVAPIAPGLVKVTPDLAKAISGAASDAQLSQTLIPLLNLPADAQLSGHFPGRPAGEANGAAQVSAALARGEVVRLLVDSGGRQQTMYLKPGQTAPAAARTGK